MKVSFLRGMFNGLRKSMAWPKNVNLS